MVCKDISENLCHCLKLYANNQQAVRIGLRDVHSCGSRLTKRGVCGDNIDPMRPVMLQIPRRECLKFVGNSSAV